MTIKEKVIKAEEEFPKNFSSWVDKPYGKLFYNDETKDSHDSNHAILYPEYISNLETVLIEIREFYQNRGITPRVYHPPIFGYFDQHLASIQSCGFELIMYENHEILTLDSKNSIKKSHSCDIKILTEWDERIATEIFIPNNEEYEIEVLKNSIFKGNTTVFVAYIEEKAVSVLYLHSTDYDCTRIDYILTSKEYRGRGIGRQIMSYAVDYLKENNTHTCYLWCINETSKRISMECGFREKFEMPAGAIIYNKD